MIEPVWVRGADIMEHNPWMESAEYAEVGNYVLYAIQAQEAHFKQQRAPKGATRTTWSLVIMPQYEDVTGGPANDMAQAKQFARMAYQATQGIILGGDA